MLRNSLPSDVPSNLWVFPTDFVGDRSRDDGPCRGAKCLALGLAVEFCEEKNVACGLSCLELLTRFSLGRAFVWFWNI